MGLQVFHFHTTGYEIDMKQKKFEKSMFLTKNKENRKNFVLFKSSVAKAKNIPPFSLKNK